MIPLKEFLGVPLRADILRGVRLAAIAFAAILLVVAGYRVLKAPPDSHVPPAEATQPEPASTPESPSPSVHSADTAAPVVPPPPPPASSGKAARKVSRQGSAPETHVARVGGRLTGTHKTTAGHNEAAAETTDTESPSDAAPDQPGQRTKIGYKSLMEADPHETAIESATNPKDDDGAKSANRGNRLFKAFGRLLHKGGAKKGPDPQSLHPQQ